MVEYVKNGWKWLAGKDAVTYTSWHEKEYQQHNHSSESMRMCENKLQNDDKSLGIVKERPAGKDVMTYAYKISITLISMI